MSLLGDALEKQTTVGLTENGAKTFTTSLSANCDFFFRAGAMRGKNKDVVDLFVKAYIEDKNLALANLFYLRDCRKGVGERDLARSIFKELVDNYPEVVDDGFLNKFVKYGRYDDVLYALTNDKTKIDIVNFIARGLDGGNSLMAKWLPSINASSKKTKYYANLIIKALNISPALYRKRLADLRQEQHLLETTMTNKDYTNIQYEHIPSQAHRKHTQAFFRNDEANYRKYLDSVQKGEKKVNTTTITPVEIVAKYNPTYSYMKRPSDDEALNTLWNNLPDLFNGKKENSLVVCDISGSMTSRTSTGTRPIDVSIALALYIAERNTGLFHNEYMSFSHDSHLVKVKGNDLYEKLNYISQADMGYDTNIESVFDNLLKACVANNIPEEECPKRIYIISDMEFNDCDIDGTDITVFECAKQKYEEAGYKLPQLFFWNVNSRQENVPVRYDETGTALISGYSPNILGYILGEEEITPESIMMKVLKNYL